jgi:SPW repeat
MVAVGRTISGTPVAGLPLEVLSYGGFAMRRETRWQDWVMLMFGVWMFFSPFILGYAALGGIAAWNSYVFGVAMVIFSLRALSVPRLWEEWVNLVLGVWIFIAPFVLGFFTLHAATWNHLILGVLIMTDALWAMASRPFETTAH